MEEIFENEEVAMEIEEYEASLVGEKAEEVVDTFTAKLTRQRNSRRKAAAKNADFKEKKSAKTKVKEINGKHFSKPKAISDAKTARRRADRRKANQLIAEQE